ncbi:hypothetical protein AB0I68_34525 [Streptomyces sp. NPDC050448]|uniref:hypothetical protein n=1 Tax=Streptomyces sp. NPDC050448 TaxID=3155404 RepID=UPI003442CB6C
MLALAILAAAVDDVRSTRPADPNRPARSSEPVDLIIPEIRRLIGAVFSPPITSLDVLLQCLPGLPRGQTSLQARGLEVGKEGRDEPRARDLGDRSVLHLSLAGLAGNGGAVVSTVTS